MKKFTQQSKFGTSGHFTAEGAYGHSATTATVAGHFQATSLTVSRQVGDNSGSGACTGAC